MAMERIQVHDLYSTSKIELQCFALLEEEHIAHHQQLVLMENVPRRSRAASCQIKNLQVPAIYLSVMQRSWPGFKLEILPIVVCPSPRIALKTSPQSCQGLFRNALYMYWISSQLTRPVEYVARVSHFLERSSDLVDLLVKIEFLSFTLALPTTSYLD